jgi:hypothetical protein
VPPAKVGEEVDASFRDYEPHSDSNRFGITINDSGSVTSSQNVTFHDQNPSYSYAVDSMPDATYSVSDTSDSNLQSFFSRPIKIAEYDWVIGQNFYEELDPWSLFFENVRVINRISNFNMMRAKLKVKFILNGNGFHYGRAIASYVPLNKKANMNIDRAFFIQDVVQASQRPHIYLDPCLSQGGELCLPYFWFKNYLSIPDQEWRQMGDIFIHGMQNLKHANGATDNVTVSVFAWAEDVTLAIPTSVEPGSISPQSGFEEFEPHAADEYGTGVISKPASIVARAAGALKDAPVIGPYARATEIGASAVSAVASTFGYSRPSTLEPIHEYKPMYLGNLANTNAKDTSVKLSTDVKQEVTLDPRVVGLGMADEMVITNVSTRESYLTDFPWTVSKTPESLLFSIAVDPGVQTRLDSGFLAIENHLPACAFAVMPFKYWRGSMEYRFQIVASNYHKGRIKIVYEPYEFSGVTAEYNTNYTYIVDIADTKDFSVKIGWGQTQAFKKHFNLSATEANMFRADGQNVTFSPSSNIGNGMLNVYVVNELTIPNSVINNDVSVNVFLKTGDDFEVAVPDMTAIEAGSYLPPPAAPQSGFEPHAGTEVQGDMEQTEEPSRPMQEQTNQEMAPTLSPSDRTLDVYFGESIQSFRALLKRYCLHKQMPIDDTSPGLPGAVSWRSIQYYFPFHRGYDTNGFWLIGGNDYSLCKFTLLNYIVPAYAGFRGGIRWKTHMWGNKNVYTYQRVTRMQTDDVYTEGSVILETGNSLDIALDLDNASLTGGEGTTAQAVANNPVLEFEIPFTTPYRFLSAKDNNWLVRNTAEYEVDTTPMFRWDSAIKLETDTAVARSDYVAAGEDFSTYFFTGAPILFSYSTPEQTIP